MSIVVDTVKRVSDPEENRSVMMEICKSGETSLDEDYVRIFCADPDDDWFAGLDFSFPSRTFAKIFATELLSLLNDKKGK